MKNKRICVFSSSCNYLSEVYYKDAERIGLLLAQNGYDMVYGGSSVGMMYSCAKVAKQNGSKLIGIMPKRLHSFGVSTDMCDEFYLSEGMRDRKQKMDELSDGVLALAGGLGTLEELTEMIVQKQLGYNSKPIVILNTNGIYDNLIKFFEQIIEEKFAGQNVRELYFLAQSPDDVIDYLNNYNYNASPRTKDEIYSR